MRIQYMSDLHMELWDNWRYVKAAIERVQMKVGFQSAEREQARPKGKVNGFDVVGDVLVLAGDTFYLLDANAPQKRFWNWASKNFRQVLLVPGNHEFYGDGDITARGDSWQWVIRENVGYYYNKVVRIDAWIYGHSHTNIDTTIGNTRIVCNQLGYVHYNEHLTNGFKPNIVIEL